MTDDLKLRIRKGNIELYSELSTHYGEQVLGFLICLFFASLFGLGGYYFFDSWFFTGIGVFILSGCVSIVIKEIKSYRNNKKNAGYIHMKANDEGILVEYDKHIIIWQQIEKITFVKTLISYKHDEDGYYKNKRTNVAIIYLKKKAIARYHRRQKSPLEKPIIYFDLPQTKHGLIQKGILGISKESISADCYNNIEFIFEHETKSPNEVFGNVINY